MGVNLADLMGMSPYLYHVTYEGCLGRIRRLQRLESAAALIDAGGQAGKLRERRDEMLDYMVGEDHVVLTDQLPVNENNIDFRSGWTLPDLIEALNRRVFFWRGGEGGLLQSNQGHFGKYEGAGHRLAVLRLGFAEAVKLNNERGPELCKHNSGAARQYQGRRIPRGPDTSVRPKDADFSKGEVQEVVFRDFVQLPVTTQVCFGSWRGPWRPLLQDCEGSG